MTLIKSDNMTQCCQTPSFTLNISNHLPLIYLQLADFDIVFFNGSVMAFAMYVTTGDNSFTPVCISFANEITSNTRASQPSLTFK
jgi:hypothetical protein